MSLCVALTCLVLMGDPAPAPDPQALADRIDRLLDERREREHVVPAGPASDEEFFRRLSLDLKGRIPTADEVRGFLADARPDKRVLAIDEFLASQEHARHFSRVWRALLMPEADVEPQLRYLEPGLEAWLQERRLNRVGFDAMVRELLAVPIVGPDEPPQMVLRDLRRPNPLAFLAAKSVDPAKIASAATRLFLGLRLECAQCHDHPFDAWTQEQFWNQAAFFAGIERRGRGFFAPLVEIASRREIPLMDSTQNVTPAFLDHTQPELPRRCECPRRVGRLDHVGQQPLFRAGQLRIVSGRNCSAGELSSRSTIFVTRMCRAILNCWMLWPRPSRRRTMT